MKGIISKKLEILGGVTSYNTTPVYTAEQISGFLDEVQRRMQALPEEEVIDFITTYGGSVFHSEVLIPVEDKPEFLSGNVPVKAVIGFTSQPSVVDYMNRYHNEYQLAVRFFPLFEGVNGDVIFYSLESHTMGAIYYWHNQGADSAGDLLFLARTFAGFIAALYSHKEEEIEPVMASAY
ncbi:hypothetical protein HNQ91_000096 [Filimonas zeae]|uniref:SMI1/KNR4 family protein n=1 Tax=Filimonas zeae TaxID=1737353 RepID=A0A917IME9_9BACT|nr:SMI1/KNR4 family protein [Filimonas zeae]MDR6337074.1 hypothetical protein [Filimonas zeae]GGH56879.1 hypothetical protein GCM10011379_00950 [Filimonas zeae]